MKILQPFIVVGVVFSLLLNAINAHERGCSPFFDARAVNQLEQTDFTGQALAAEALLERQTLGPTVRERLTAQFHRLTTGSRLSKGDALRRENPRVISIQSSIVPKIVLKGIPEVWGGDRSLTWQTGLTIGRLLQELPDLRDRLTIPDENPGDFGFTLSPDVFFILEGVAVRGDEIIKDTQLAPGARLRLVLGDEAYPETVVPRPLMVPSTLTGRIRRRIPDFNDRNAAALFIMIGGIAVLFGQLRYGAVMILLGLQILIEMKTPLGPGAGRFKGLRARLGRGA